jgi:hypothetical protein
LSTAVQVQSKCRHATSELGVSALSGRKERVVPFIHSLLLLLPSATQQQLVVHTLITHCNYTLPPLLSANKIDDSTQTIKPASSANVTSTTTTIHHQINSKESSPSRSSSYHKPAGLPVHGSLQRAREPYPPAQLTSLAGSTGFARWRFAPALAPSILSTLHTAHPRM